MIREEIRGRTAGDVDSSEPHAPGLTSCLYLSIQRQEYHLNRYPPHPRWHRSHDGAWHATLKVPRGAGGSSRPIHKASELRWMIMGRGPTMVLLVCRYRWKADSMAWLSTFSSNHRGQSAIVPRSLSTAHGQRSLRQTVQARSRRSRQVQVGPGYS